MNEKSKILLVHNRYQQQGGEDSVVDEEMKMLEAHGHNVKLYTRNNTDIDHLDRTLLFVSAIWSKRTIRDLEQIISVEKPDIIHIHNTFPLISPSVYWVAKKHNIPTIQTIHNFRLSCIQAMYIRNMKVCEDCLKKGPWRGAIRKCYRGSILASVSSAMIIQFHRIIGTYQNKIDTYIALNEFCKQKLIEMGLPKDKIKIKPNFVTLEHAKRQIRDGNPLYVGRLSEEKGISVLANSIKSIPNQVFDIVGDGPDKKILQRLSNVRLLGKMDQAGVYRLMQKTPFLIMPSVWYENMPRTLVESYGNATPIIASRIGALGELITHMRTGLLFECGSVDDLSDSILWALQNPDEMNKMGYEAHTDFIMKYTDKVNYRLLMEIYNNA
ncbi:MAG: glycosyltransferase family 4 protein [Candidatus Thiodiazotropha sp.]